MIVPIDSQHVRGFHDCLDSVAREARYIAMIEAPPLKSVTAFVEGNIERGCPQLVALDGDRVVGWSDVIPHRRIGFSHGGVLGMGVRASHRRRGIGRRLLSAALAAARDLGLLRVELEVYASNAAAISLYEKTGFRHEGRKTKARLFNGAFDDVLPMALPMDEE